MKVLVALSALIASLFIGGVLAALLGRGPSYSAEEKGLESGKALIEVGTPSPVQQEPRGEAVAGRTETTTPSPQKSVLIEDILAESGEEDPEAIYYVSRIREAMREGNPTVAQELLQRMKSKHQSPVLVDEAEALVQGER